MLRDEDWGKIEIYIDKLVKALYADIRKNMDSGMKPRDVIDSAVRLTVNKLTPESKMVLSSAYHMMAENTLAGALYQDSQNKAAFYSRNILNKINARFVFDVPNHIDYEEVKGLLNEWIAAGVITVAGGVITILAESVIPIAIAAVIAGIMLFLLKDKPINKSQDIDPVIKDYLENVRISLMAWLKEIENFYDEEIVILEKEIKK